MPSFRLTRPLMLCLLALGLGGCAAVGPNYGGPPTVAGEATQAGSAFTRAARQDTTAVQPSASSWWRALGDDTLNNLVDQALANSPDLHAAQARLRQARASLTQQEAQHLPKGSATAAAIGARMAPGTDAAQSIHLYSVGFDATWEIDLFGGTRRAVEAASAEADAVVADLADTQVSLTAEVVQAYTALRDQQQRRALVLRSSELDERTLALTQQLRDRGVASAMDIEKLLSQAERNRADVAELDAQIAASLDELALLTGQSPGALDTLLRAIVPLPSVPAIVAIGDPASLLQRRPDIRAAERRLASSQAQIGEKTAGYFPKLNLLGDIGFSATDPAHLIRRSNALIAGVPYLSWNLLDFGRNRAAVRQAEASHDEAIARYQGTVLVALRDANTALSRYGHQREKVLSLLNQEASAQRLLNLAEQRRQVGAASLIEVFDAENTLGSARQSTSAGQAELLRDFVSLQKSLGLGWEAAL